MTLIGYTIYNRLCVLVNECITNTIIYNYNIPLLLKKIKDIDKQNKLTKNEITVTPPLSNKQNDKIYMCLMLTAYLNELTWEKCLLCFVLSYML